MSRWRVIAVAIGLLAAVAVWGWFRSMGRFSESMNNVYAAMRVGYSITEHIEATGRWPASWSELRPTFERGFGGGDIDDYYKEVQQIVGVKWNVSLDELRDASSSRASPFPVVWCVSGEQAGPTAHHEANSVIFEYLTKREPEPSLGLER